MITSVRNSDVQVTDNNLIVYPKDKKITDKDLAIMISQNESFAQEYRENFNMYLGKHKILSEHKETWGPDYKLVVNIPKYICDTFTSFFVGIPPKITLDDKNANNSLQQWNDSNSFQDKLAEVSKQVDIYGRSIMFLYQNEERQTRIAIVPPTEGFIVYDDTVAQRPIAFVRYGYANKSISSEYSGTIYYADSFVDFEKNKLLDGENPNIYKMVPAVEFFANTERQGAFDSVKTLCNALDESLSNKANQVAYYDTAYLKILGMQLPTDEEGNLKATEIRQSRLIYSPDSESANATVDFIGKPDADQLQEHYIDRLLNLIYQISMVPNLSDKEFASNQSGVAIRYKLLAIQNLASAKERKFTQSLRALYQVLFSIGEVANKDDWQQLSFQFNWNIPANIEDEAQTAQTLMGVVSHETAMKPLSVVDDPKQELEKIREEQAEATRNALTMTDIDKADDNGSEE